MFFPLQLTSLPVAEDNSDSLILSYPMFAPILTSPERPSATYFCEKRVDPITGLIDIFINFTYEYNPLIEEAIINYTVIVSDTSAQGGTGVPQRGKFIYNPVLISEVNMLFIANLLL